MKRNSDPVNLVSRLTSSKISNFFRRRGVKLLNKKVENDVFFIPFYSNTVHAHLKHADNKNY